MGDLLITLIENLYSEWFLSNHRYPISFLNLSHALLIAINAIYFFNQEHYIIRIVIEFEVQIVPFFYCVLSFVPYGKEDIQFFI